MSDQISTTNWTQFWLQSVLVIMGIIAAGVFAFLSWKTSEKFAKLSLQISEKSWKTTQLSNQIYTDEILINTRKEFRELSIRIQESIAENKIEKVKILSGYLDQIIEDVLNAYELSCGLYFSGGVDKDRFRKLRKREIISLFEARKKDGTFLYKQLNYFHFGRYLQFLRQFQNYGMDFIIKKANPYWLE
jgi:hypothetical protein